MYKFSKYLDAEVVVGCMASHCTFGNCQTLTSGEVTAVKH